MLGGTSVDIGMRRRADRAHGEGLPATPLERTAADVLAWDLARGEPPLAVELAPDREAQLPAEVDAATRRR